MVCNCLLICYYLLPDYYLSALEENSENTTASLQYAYFLSKHKKNIPVSPFLWRSPHQVILLPFYTYFFPICIHSFSSPSDSCPLSLFNDRYQRSCSSLFKNPNSRHEQ